MTPLRPRRATALVLALVTVGVAGTSQASGPVPDPPTSQVTPDLAVPSVEAGRYQPGFPTRVFDSLRAVRPGAVVPLALAGNAQVPLTGASAVSLVLTVRDSSGASGVLAWRGGSTRPGAPFVQVARGGVATAQVVVPLGVDGTVDLGVVGSPARVQVDVAGWFTSGPLRRPGTLVAMAPTRVLDTRSGVGALPDGAVVRVPVAGQGSAPAGGLGSVAVTLTVSVATRSGHLEAWSGQGGSPGTSSLSYRVGQVVSTQAVLPVSPDGTVALRNVGGSAQVVVDLVGWALPARTPLAAAGALTAIEGGRLLDTRATRAVPDDGLVEVPVLGRAGVPATGVSAVALLVTALGAPRRGTLTAYPSDRPAPLVPSATYVARSADASLITVPVGRDGRVRLRSHGSSTHLLVDVQAWYAAPAVPSSLALAPVDAARLAGGLLRSADGRRAAQVLRTTNRYALRTWWPTVAPVLLGSIQGTRIDHDAVRRLGNQAFGLAVSLRTGAYDPAAVGVPRDTAEAIAVSLVDAASAEHGSNRPGGWRSGPQGSLWSAPLAHAGWLLWDALPARTRAQVARMVELEADDAMQVAPGYLRDANGRVVPKRIGDTAAEENSWQAMPLQIATALLPGHPHWRSWRHAQVQLELASWVRPQDVRSGAVVNGRPLSDWVDGSNVEADGTLVNHLRIAPDYMTTIYQSADAIVFDALAGVPTPEAARVGLANVYRAMSAVRYDPRRYAAPGGVIYQSRGTPVYYPQGCDWGTGQALPYALMDAQAAAFGWGTAASPSLESRHVGVEQGYQRTYADGRSYPLKATKQRYIYRGREEHTAQLAGLLYLTKLVRDRQLSMFTADSAWNPAQGVTTAVALPRELPPLPGPVAP